MMGQREKGGMKCEFFPYYILWGEHIHNYILLISCFVSQDSVSDSQNVNVA